MARTLNAFLDGLLVGRFTQGDNGGQITFEYDDAWRRRSNRIQLSISLPKSKRLHPAPIPANFLWGLLPDNDGVLQRWGARFGVSPRNPLALLEHVGRDVAGAIQLSADDDITSRGWGFELISDEEIAAQLRLLHADPEAWLLPGTTDGNFSLAGAQPKFALTRLDNSWGLPTGDAASTHIFKPGALGFSLHALNEHLCLGAAANLGLNTAVSDMHDFDGERVIVVTRYDREVVDGDVLRNHQEDFVQALGLHPELKYQNDGGPSIRDSLNLITTAVRSREAAAAGSEFYSAIIFNWLIAGTDAHAKNYSLLHSESGPRLAPLYDISSALPYPELSPRKIKLAMSVDAHYRVWEVSPAELIKEAEASGLDGGWAHDQIRDFANELPGALRDAINAARLTDGRDIEFAERLHGLITERAAGAVGRLGRARTPAVAAKAREFVRRRDLGLSDNGGRFASTDK